LAPVNAGQRRGSPASSQASVEPSNTKRSESEMFESRRKVRLTPTTNSGSRACSTPNSSSSVMGALKSGSTALEFSSRPVRGSTLELRPNGRKNCDGWIGGVPATAG
jgi:hypothetical protein